MSAIPSPRSGLYDENPDRVLTPLVVTLWYRAPELLLGEIRYNPTVDLWATGCIFYELITLKPLFPGKSELDELDIIFSKLGTPTEAIWPGFSKLPHCQRFGFVPRDPTDWAHAMKENSTEAERELVQRCLVYDPRVRISASEALQSPFFTSELPAPEKFVLSRELLDSMPTPQHSS